MALDIKLKQVKEKDRVVRKRAEDCNHHRNSKPITTDGNNRFYRCMDCGIVYSVQLRASVVGDYQGTTNKNEIRERG